MEFKKQVKRVREQWLLLLIIAVLVFTIPYFKISPSSSSTSFNEGSIASSDVARSFGTSSYYGGDIAPEVQERIRSISYSLDLEVPKNSFDTSVKEATDIFSETDSIVISESSNTFGGEDSQRRRAYFNVRIPETEYENAIDRLESLGEVNSISKNTEDITGTVYNLEIELEAEQLRLQQYKGLLEDATNAEEKLNLIDRIFDQERRVSYLQEALENQGQRVDYITLSLSISEKPGIFSSVTFVTLKDIVKSFVGSVSSIIYLIAVIIPYLIAIWIIVIIYRSIKKRN